MAAASDTDGQAPQTGGWTPRAVLFLTPLWGRDGGVAAHVKESAAALARSGVGVRVLAARVEEEQVPDGVSVQLRPRLADARAPLSERIGELPVEVELTHLHQLDDRAMLEAMRERAPVVVSAHGYPGCTSGVYYFAAGQECTRGHGPGCIPNLLARGCAHTRYPRTLPGKYREVTRGLAALRRADLVISYSRAVDRHLAANGLASRAIVPYFPTMAPVAGSGHATRRRVLFAGRLVQSKGVDVLIRAAAEVDCDLVVCGEGRQREELIELARGLGSSQRVRFAGWMGAQELAREFAQASLIAVPSVWPEPFGIVGIEGLAAGRPAVASATGGILDWLVDGRCGLLVAPGDAAALADALRRLLDDPDLQQEMGAAGRELVASRFSPERHVEKLLEAYGAARSARLSAAALPAPA